MVVGNQFPQTNCVNDVLGFHVNELGSYTMFGLQFQLKRKRINCALLLRVLRLSANSL